MADKNYLSSVGDISTIGRPASEGEGLSRAAEEVKAQSSAEAAVSKRKFDESMKSYTGGTTPQQMVEQGIPLPIGVISPAGREAIPAQVQREKIGQLQSTQLAPDQDAVSRTWKQNLNLFGLSEDLIDKYTKEYEEAIPGFQEQMKNAKKLYEQKTEALGKEQAIVAMFKILGHLALGMYGAKYGVDTSGIKFDPLDWTARQKKIMDEYEIETSMAESGYKKVESRYQRMQDLRRYAREQAEQTEKEERRAKEGKISTANARLLQELSIIGQETKEADIEEKAGRKEQAMESLTAEKKKLAEQKQADMKERQQYGQLTKQITNLAKAKKTDEQNQLAKLVAPQVGALGYEAWKATPEGKGLLKNEGHWRDYVMDKAADFLSTGAPASGTIPTAGSGGKVLSQAALEKVAKERYSGNVEAAKADALKRGYKIQ